MEGLEEKNHLKWERDLQITSSG